MSHFCLTIGGTEVRSLNDLLAVMRDQLERFDSEADHRAAFLRVYYTMTGSVGLRLERNYFLDRAWVERVAIRFAWYYFDALDRYERFDGPPPAWAYAFDIARRREGFLLQDVLLGMNAHINNDLPLVVAEILQDEGDTAPPHRLERRRYDHDQINRVLHEIIPTAEEAIATHYGRLIRPLSRILGSLDVTLAAYELKTFRDKVWRNALFLLAATTEQERQQVIHFIQEDALDVARQIERFGPLRPFRPWAAQMRRWRWC